MRRKLSSYALCILFCVLFYASAVSAQQPLKMWYRGAFEGWVELRNDPVYGWYYTPSPSAAYPLHESAYGKPIPCEKCGHVHYPGEKVCPVCGQPCPGGGNNLDPRTVYRPDRLPGQYYYKEQPHYRFVSPLRLGGTYLKYTRPYD